MKSLLATVAVLSFAGVALAHDHNNPQLTEWYRAQKNQNGSPCCDGQDAAHLEAPDWDTKCEAGKGCHYRVMLEGKWYDVPDYAVVLGPNKAGFALVWAVSTPYAENKFVIRCFMPGAGT